MVSSTEPISASRPLPHDIAFGYARDHAEIVRDEEIAVFSPPVARSLNASSTIEHLSL